MQIPNSKFQIPNGRGVQALKLLLLILGLLTFTATAQERPARQATDAEVVAGSDVKAYVNPKQYQDNMTGGGGGGITLLQATNVARSVVNQTNPVVQTQLQASLTSGTNDYHGKGASLTNLANANIDVPGTNIVTRYNTNATTGQITATNSVADPLTVNTLNVTNMILSTLKPASGGTNVLIIHDDGTLGTNSPANFGTGKFKYLKFNFPRYQDGTGCTVPNTNDFTADNFMVPLFSPSAVSNANFCRFAIRVPPDLDTNSDLTASLTMAMGASNSGDQQYALGMVCTPFDGAIGPVTNYVGMLLGGIVSGSNGHIVSKDNVTLTGWKSAAVPGQWWLIELQRSGTDGHDAGTAATYLKELEIAYRSTQ